MNTLIESIQGYIPYMEIVVKKKENEMNTEKRSEYLSQCHRVLSNDLEQLGSECVICLETARHVTVKLHCGHQFHLQCIEKWLAYSYKCPMCRSKCINAEFP